MERIGNRAFYCHFCITEVVSVRLMIGFRSVLDLKKGESAVVQRFSDTKLAASLMSLGIIPNASISVVRRSPLGGAVYLQLGMTYIAVRNSAAQSILVK